MKSILRKLAVAFVIGLSSLTGVWAALETGTYISDLNSANPTATDPLSQADDHLRLIKSLVKASFPNITGAMTLSHTQLNLLDQKTLAGTGYQKMPSGLMFQWGSGTTNGSGVATVSYPITFPTSHIMSNCTQGSGNYTISTAFGAASTTAALFVGNSGAAAGSGLTVYCLAIGY